MGGTKIWQDFYSLAPGLSTSAHWGQQPLHRHHFKDHIPSVKTYYKTREQKMELEDFYNNAKCKNLKDTNGPQRHCNYEEKARSCRGRRFLVPVTVCLGIICLLLIAAIILQHFQATTKRGYLWGPDGLFISSELKSWSDSRQYCRDRGADLVIINTEEKQRHISSFIKDKVWIGLSDTENEGNMKWVDNSPMNQGFWAEGEPNNYYGKSEDCIEMRPSDPVLNNWNDIPCSEKRKGICEK